MNRLTPDIIFENEAFVAVNKPAGMLSIPDREQSEKSLKDWLMERYGSIFTVHRLDKDTSGLILFAKTKESHHFLSGLFEGRKIEKYYTGVVIGRPAEKEGLIDAPIAEHPVKKGLMCIHRSGKSSQTGYEVLQSFPAYSLVCFRLHTGRTHQIRVHCKNWGHPLACDEFYGDGKPVFLSSIKKKYKTGKLEEEKPIIERLALHSYRLVFDDENGIHHDITAPIPKTFKALMQQLEKNS